jgi:hypothetical protein
MRAVDPIYVGHFYQCNASHRENSCSSPETVEVLENSDVARQRSGRIAPSIEKGKKTWHAGTGSTS